MLEVIQGNLVTWYWVFVEREEEREEEAEEEAEEETEEGRRGGGRRERGEGRSEEAAAVQRSAAPPLRHCGCREINPKQDAAPFEDSTRANSDSIVIFDRETGDTADERGTWGEGGTQGSL